MSELLIVADCTQRMGSVNFSVGTCVKDVSCVAGSVVAFLTVEDCPVGFLIVWVLTILGLTGFLSDSELFVA